MNEIFKKSEYNELLRSAMDDSLFTKEELYKMNHLNSFDRSVVNELAKYELDKRGIPYRVDNKSNNIELIYKDSDNYGELMLLMSASMARYIYAKCPIDDKDYLDNRDLIIKSAMDRVRNGEINQDEEGEDEGDGYTYYNIDESIVDKLKLFKYKMGKSFMDIFLSGMDVDKLEKAMMGENYGDYVKAVDKIKSDSDKVNKYMNDTYDDPSKLPMNKFSDDCNKKSNKMNGLYDLYSADLDEYDLDNGDSIEDVVRSAMYDLDEKGKERKVIIDRFEFSNLLKLVDNKDYEFNKLMTDNSDRFNRIIVNLLKSELDYRGIPYDSNGVKISIREPYKVRQIEFDMLVYACMLRYYGDRNVPLNTQPYFNEHRDKLIEKAVIGD